nr:immunoglobulin light chain junction region [Macaca mulatta]
CMQALEFPLFTF